MEQLTIFDELLDKFSITNPSGNQMNNRVYVRRKEINSLS